MFLPMLRRLPKLHDVCRAARSRKSVAHLDAKLPALFPTVPKYQYELVHVRVPVRARTNVRVFEQNLLTRAVESTRGHLDELSVQYVLRVLYILALRAPSRVLFSFHSTRPHILFFLLPIFSFTQAEWCNHTAYTKRV